MSTRSTIGVQSKDGTIQAVYCHFDGYPAGVGAALLASHNNEEAARQLVALGDLRCVSLSRGVEAYKDREGEEWEVIKPKALTGDPALIEFAAECNAAFVYLWRDGGWACASRRGAWKSLAKAVKADQSGGDDN